MILFLFIIDLLFLYLISSLNTPYYIELTFILIVINLIVILYLYIITVRNFKILFIVFTALSIRIVFLILNMFYGFTLPHDGTDTEYFNFRAENFLMDLKNGDLRDSYISFLGIVYLFTENNRLFGQFVNILLFLGTFFYLYKSLILLHIGNKYVYLSLIVLSFFPQSIIFSVILLRESFILFLCTLSIYLWIKFFKKQNIIYLISSIFVILFMSTVHSGMIVLLLPIIILSVIYSFSENKFKMSMTNIIILVVTLLISIVPISIFFESIFSKFINYTSDRDLYVALSTTKGESAYLESLNYSNIFDVLLFSPLKFLYFYVSPIPFDWRSMVDAFSFLFDSSLYLFAIVYSIINFKIIKSNPVTILLLLMIVFFGIVFGYGTSAAGTAIRHRYKVISIIILLIALIQKGKKA